MVSITNMEKPTIFKSTVRAFAFSYIIGISSAFIFGRLASNFISTDDGLGFAIISMLIWFFIGVLGYTISFLLLMKNSKKTLLKETIVLDNITIFGLYILTVIIGFYSLRFVLPTVMSIFLR